ncbi:MAG: hypothetical protein KAH31_07960 [Candidatus Sabulitectum sp.]|nr:hypothetical protein [Candidatus Sabulitectum sp.]
MSAVILYTTKYGTAEKCAGILQKKASDSVQSVNIKDSPEFDLTPFSTVVLGASVYVEKIQREMSAFCEKNREELLKKKIGLYICSGDTGKAGRGYLKLFGKDIHNHAISKKLFGSEIYWEKMNPIEKLAMRIIKKSKGSSSDLQMTAIDDFVAEMKLK